MIFEKCWILGELRVIDELYQIDIFWWELVRIYNFEEKFMRICANWWILSNYVIFLQLINFIENLWELMDFVVLQNISSNMALLCHYDSTIIDNDNSITNIEGSNVISNVKLDI